MLNGALLALLAAQLRIGGLWNNFQTARRTSRFLRKAGLSVMHFEPGRKRWGLPINVKILAARDVDWDCGHRVTRSTIAVRHTEKTIGY